MHQILEFILPIMAASAEAMIWVLIVVVLVVIGRGAMAPSEKPIFIERNGKFRMHLAPGLNLAQPFIEAIADKVGALTEAKPNGLAFRFKVQDANIATRKLPFYLLEVSMQDGFLCFEARPAPQEAVADPVSPLTEAGHTAPHDFENAVHAVAKSWGVGVCRVG